MAKQVTSENQEDIDAMIRAADRGELIHHPEAAVRRDPGAPLLTDEQAASLMAQSLANLEKLEERRAEARTARRTWRVRVPKDLDDKASLLAKKEGIPKSAIIRKAVARYVQDTDKQPTTA